MSPDFPAPLDIRPIRRKTDPPAQCRAFLKSLGQTVKLVTLYRSNHPVPSSSMAESLHLLQEIFSETDWGEVSFGLVEGSWLVNGETLGKSEVISDVLALVFRGHAIESATFQPGVRLHEIASFCELAATPAHKAYETDADAFLRQRGVKSVRVNIAEFARVRRGAAPAPRVKSPIPLAEPGEELSGTGTGKAAGTGSGNGPATGTSPEEGPGAGAGPDGSSEGFGSFIKKLVEQSVQNPVERAQVYAQTVRMVRDALEGHVAEATRSLRMEKSRVSSEQSRTHGVLAAIAEGRFVVDKDGRVIMMDPAAEAIAGGRLVEFAGKPLASAVSPEEHVLALAKDLRSDPEAAVSAEVHVVGEEEIVDAFRRSVALVQDEEGKVVGTYSALPFVAKFREALKLQEEFVASVTHELKTPLAAIGAALEALQKEVRSGLDPDQANLLEISLRNTGVLRRMIGEILDFSHIQSGRMTVLLEETRVEPILRESVEGLIPWASGRGLTLIAESGKELKRLPNVRADHSRVVQILNNLISNAVKATPEGGKIFVSAAKGGKEHEGSVVFSVRDTGRGIAPVDQKRIFEKFTQVHEGGVRREGVGLGLSIANELVRLHGGTLWLESELGRGAAFFFAIPKA